MCFIKYQKAAGQEFSSSPTAIEVVVVMSHHLLCCRSVINSTKTADVSQCERLVRHV